MKVIRRKTNRKRTCKLKHFTSMSFYFIVLLIIAIAMWCINYVDEFYCRDDDIKKLMEVDSDSDDDPFGSSSKIEKPSKQSAMQHNLVDEKKVLEKLFKKKATSREEQFLYDYIIAEG